MKVCRTCKEELPLSSFCKQTKNKDGLNSQCRSCYKKDYEARKLKVEETFTLEGTKQCRTCEKELPKNMFNRSPTLLGGLDTECRLCSNKRNREHWKGRKEHYTERQRKRHKDNPLRLMYYKAKSRSKKEGIPFNIELSDLKLPEVCPVLGIPLEVGNIRLHDGSPSLDKFIPELGYVKGNVQVISMKANSIKTNATTEEVRKVYEWMKQQEDN